MKINEDELQEIYGEVKLYKVLDKDLITKNVSELNSNNDREVKLCYYKKMEFIILWKLIVLVKIININI